MTDRRNQKPPPFSFALLRKYYWVGAGVLACGLCLAIGLPRGCGNRNQANYEALVEFVKSSDKDVRHFNQIISNAQNFVSYYDGTVRDIQQWNSSAEIKGSIWINLTFDFHVSPSGTRPTEVRNKTIIVRRYDSYTAANGSIARRFTAERLLTEEEWQRITVAEDIYAYIKK